MKRRIFCDGGCSPNPGVGGWGWLTADGEDMGYGGQIRATNNEMELVAIREALTSTPAGCEVEILSDSEYALAVIDGTKRAYPDHLRIVHEIRNLRDERVVIFELIRSHCNEAHILVREGRRSI